MIHFLRKNLVIVIIIVQLAQILVQVGLYYARLDTRLFNSTWARVFTSCDLQVSEVG